MTNLRLIINNSPPMQKRVPYLDEFIHQLSLCHNLSCVIKYLVRSVQAESKLHDLQMAEWHLFKKIIKEQEKLPQEISEEPCSEDTLHKRDLHYTSPELDRALGKAWGLSDKLIEPLYYITTFQNESARYPFTSLILLKHAHVILHQEANKHDPLSMFKRIHEGDS